MLTLTEIHSYYGRAHILQGVSFTLRQGEVMALLGRNGAGKSTTMKSVIGIVRPAAGRIVFAGNDTTGWEPQRIARAGVGYAPEERRIFADLTVTENLQVGRQPARAGRLPWTEQRLFELFPTLGRMRTRLGRRMSGGEQQMLTIARTLMGNPTLLLLDEPCEGLAPVVVEQMAQAILTLKRDGVTILLADHNLHFAARVADRAAVIQQGRIAWTGTMLALQGDTVARDTYLAA